MLTTQKNNMILLAVIAALMSFGFVACENSDSDDADDHDDQHSGADTESTDDEGDSSDETGDEDTDDNTGEDTDDGEEDSETPDDTDADTVGDVGSDEDSSSDPPADPAYIRVLHLSPDAPAVDVYAGDQKAVTSLPYAEGTDYLELPAGSYTFDVAPEMTSSADSVLTFEDVPLEAGNYYTAVAYDAVASITGLALVDDVSAPEEGNIRVRAIHAASGVGEVDIWNLPAEGDPGLLYENVPLGAAGDYMELPAGAYTLGFDANDDMVPDLIFALPELASGTIASLFAVNDADGVSLVAQLAGDQTAKIGAGEAMVRVIHLSPDAPAVDVFANGGGEPVISELAYGASSDFLTVPAAGYDFQVAVSGSSASDAVLSLDGALLLPGKSYTAVAYDTVSNISAMALEDNMSAPEEGNIRVRAIHAASGVGEVDIWNLPAEGDPGLLYENVPLGAAGNYMELPAGAYTLGFDANDDMVPDLIFALPELPAGTVASVFAVNDDEGVALVALLAGDATAKIPAGESMIRVIHLSPEAPAVDVFANDAEAAAISGLEFGASSEFLAVPSGGYDFQVSVSGDSAADAVLNLDGNLLLPGAYYTAVAYSDGESIGSMVIVDDSGDLADENLRVRAIHAAAGVGEVDIWNITEGAEAGILWENVPLAAAGQYYDLPAGAYSVGFDVNNDASPDVSFDLPELPAGTIANVFAVNDGAVKLIAQLWDGTTAEVLAQ